MNEQQTSSSLWLSLISALTGLLLAVGGFLGVLWNRRRSRVETQTLELNAPVERESKAVETSARAGEFVLKVLERADHDLEEVRRERDALDREIRTELKELARKVETIDREQAHIFQKLGERDALNKLSEEE